MLSLNSISFVCPDRPNRSRAKVRLKHVVRIKRPLKAFCKCICSKLFDAASSVTSSTRPATGPNSVHCGSVDNPSNIPSKIVGSLSHAVVNYTRPGLFKKFGGAFSCGGFSLGMGAVFAVKGSICGNAEIAVRGVRKSAGVFTSAVGC